MTVEKLKRIYVPFQFAEGSEIKDLPFEIEFDTHGVSLGQNSPFYTIELSKVHPDQSEEHFKRLLVALKWMALELKVGVLTQSSLQENYYPPDPIKAAKNIFGETTERRMDVGIDGGRSAIWLEGLAVVKMTAQPVKGILSYSPKNIASIIETGMKIANSGLILENEKLLLAIDLYCLAHFRASDFARFLVLWAAIEAVAPDSERPSEIALLVDKWMREARELQLEADEIGSLIGGLSRLKKKSHGQRIRRFVQSMLKFVGDPDEEKLAAEITRLYGLRGQISHSGRYDRIGGALSLMDDIVCRTLKASMRFASKA